MSGQPAAEQANDAHHHHHHTGQILAFQGMARIPKKPHLIEGKKLQNLMNNAATFLYRHSMEWPGFPVQVSGIWCRQISSILCIGLMGISQASSSPALQIHGRMTNSDFWTTSMNRRRTVWCTNSASAALIGSWVPWTALCKKWMARAPRLSDTGNSRCWREMGIEQNPKPKQDSQASGSIEYGHWQVHPMCTRWHVSHTAQSGKGPSAEQGGRLLLLGHYASGLQDVHMPSAQSEMHNHPTMLSKAADQWSEWQGMGPQTEQSRMQGIPNDMQSHHQSTSFPVHSTKPNDPPISQTVAGEAWVCVRHQHVAPQDGQSWHRAPRGIRHRRSWLWGMDFIIWQVTAHGDHGIVGEIPCWECWRVGMKTQQPE